ncbi:MAG: transposase, partial [Nitrososphaera sp.]
MFHNEETVTGLISCPERLSDPIKIQIHCHSTSGWQTGTKKKDIKKGRKVKSPYVSKPYLVSCYGFKINDMLSSFPVSNREFANILLNNHTTKILSDKTLQPRSFVITPTTLSITVRKDVQEIKPEYIIGIDRNLRNITISTPQQAIMYGTNKILSIKENQFVKASFRQKMNSWSFYKFQRQLRYNAAWEGIPVSFIDPKHTGQLCPRCGGQQEDGLYHRKLWCSKLWCSNCMRSMNCDIAASMNIAYRGWSRFCHPRGLLAEAVKGNVDLSEPLIRVDGSKWIAKRQPR